MADEALIDLLGELGDEQVVAALLRPPELLDPASFGPGEVVTTLAAAGFTVERSAVERVLAAAGPPDLRVHAIRDTLLMSLRELDEVVETLGNAYPRPYLPIVRADQSTGTFAPSPREWNRDIKRLSAVLLIVVSVGLGGAFNQETADFVQTVGTVIAIMMAAEHQRKRFEQQQGDDSTPNHRNDNDTGSTGTDS